MAAPCSVPGSSPTAAAVAWGGEARLHQQEGLDMGGEVGAHLQSPGTSLGDYSLGAGEANKSDWSLQTFIGVLSRRERKLHIQMPIDCSILRSGEGSGPWSCLLWF